MAPFAKLRADDLQHHFIAASLVGAAAITACSTTPGGDPPGQKVALEDLAQQGSAIYGGVTDTTTHAVIDGSGELLG